MNKFKAKAAKPEVIFIGGTVMLGLSLYLTRKAAKKEDSIKEEYNKTKGMITAYLDDLDNDDSISEEERRKAIEECKKDLHNLRLKTIKSYGKIYILPGGLAIGGFACMFKSHSMLKTENQLLGGYLLAAWQGLADYRGRVAEAVGEEKERELYFGLKDETIEVEDENGKKTKKKVKVIKEGMYSPSPYSLFFDGSSKEYKPDAEYNKMVLLSTQDHFNAIYDRDGVVTLYDIVEYLDLMKKKDIPLQFHLVGWHKDRELNDCVDFGLANTNSLAVRRFMNGYETVVLLDFNCYDISDFMPSLTFLK